MAEIQEIEIEKRYLEQWGEAHPEIELHYIKKYHLDYEKTVDLFAYLKYIGDRSLTWKDKWNLLISFKIFRSKFLNNIPDRESFIFSLQYTYYEKLLIEKNEKKDALDKILQEVDFDQNLKQLTESSMEFLYGYISRNMPDEIPEFSAKEYQKHFSKFISCFPVIGSSTHSLINSIATGYLFDYVIIDEASQQDLIPGILCFGCAKNVVIVGDRKQLSHIPVHTDIIAPDKLYDCVSYERRRWRAGHVSGAYCIGKSYEKLSKSTGD